MHKPLKGCSVAVEYKSADEATGDMELSPLQYGFCVQALCQTGIAHSSGVRGGHLLSAFLNTDAKILGTDKPVWESLNPHKDLPAVLRSLQECSQMPDTDELDWPVRLEFHTLPIGWRCVCELPLTEGAGGYKEESAPVPGPLPEDVQPPLPGADDAQVQFSLGRLDELIETCNNAVLQFERQTQVVITRTTMALRHEHMWERELKSKIHREDDYKGPFA